MYGRIAGGLEKAGTDALRTKAKYARRTCDLCCFPRSGPRVLGLLSGDRVRGAPAAAGFSTSSRTLAQALANGGVVRSPYPDLAINEEISLPHFVISQMDEFGDKTALVRKQTDTTHLNTPKVDVRMPRPRPLVVTASF